MSKSKKQISLRKLLLPRHPVLHGPINIHDIYGRNIPGYATYDQNDSSLTFRDNGSNGSQRTRTFDLLMIPNITMNTLDEWKGRLDTNCSINHDVSCTINSFALLGLISREQAIILSIYRNSLHRPASDTEIIQATQSTNDMRSLKRYKEYIMADFHPNSLTTITENMGINDAILLNLIYHGSNFGHTVVLLKTVLDNGKVEIILADPQRVERYDGMANIMNYLFRPPPLLVDKISLLYLDRSFKTLLPQHDEVDKRMRVSPTFEEKMALTSVPRFSMGKRSSPKKTKKKLPNKKLPKKKGGKTKKRNVKKA